MTRTSTTSTATSSALSVVWFALAIAGLIGTWWFNIAYFGEASEYSYIDGWFANAASSSASVDIMVVAIAACIFMLVEGARLGWAKWVWVLVVLSFVVALAFTLPLFFALRERALARRAASSPERGSTIEQAAQ